MSPEPAVAPRREAAGQATVELALLLPLLVLLALFVVQMGRLGRDQVLVAHGARAAARAVALGGDASRARPAALAAASLDPARLRVQVDGPNADGLVSVRLSYDSPVGVPGLRAAVGVSGEATMRAEAGRGPPPTGVSHGPPLDRSPAPPRGYR